MVDPSNNLPTSHAYAYSDTNIPVEALNTTITAVSNANHNLSEPKKELLALALLTWTLCFQEDTGTDEVGHVESQSSESQSTYLSLQDSYLSQVCRMPIR